MLHVVDAVELAQLVCRGRESCQLAGYAPRRLPDFALSEPEEVPTVLQLKVVVPASTAPDGSAAIETAAGEGGEPLGLRDGPERLKQKERCVPSPNL